MKGIFLAIIKILAFLLILPLIIASIIAFQNQILGLPVRKEAWVLWGAGCYVALNLFVFDFKNVYVFGKSWIDKWITFFKAAGYVIPVYPIFFILVYEIARMLGRGDVWEPYFLFAVAFSITMHLVLTAHEIYEADSSMLKSHYLLVFGAVLVVNFIIISLLLACSITEYSLIGFFKSFFSHTCHLYKSVYKGLFVDSSI